MSDFDASFVKGTRHEADGNSPLFGSSHRTGPPVCACPGPHKLRIDEWDPADTGNLDIDKKADQGVTCRRSHAPVPTAETAPCVSLKPEKDYENQAESIVYAHGQTR